MALVLSGFPTDRFVFEGFLPRRGTERRDRIAALVPEAAHRRCIYESPRRVHATLTQLLAACGPLREVAVARELTKLHQEVWRGPLEDAVGHVELTEPRGEHVHRARPRRRPRPRPTTTRSTPTSPPRSAEGLSTRDAAARVARDLRVPRRRTYDAATRLKPKRS